MKVRSEIIQPGASKYIIVKPCEIVEHDPGKGKSNRSSPKAGTKSDGYIHPKYLWFDLNLTEYIKDHPGRRCSQEVKKQCKESVGSCGSSFKQFDLCLL